MRVLALVFLSFALTAATAEADPPSQRDSRRSACPTAHEGLRFYIDATNRWRRLMGEPARQLAAAVVGCPRHLASVWRTKARSARKQYRRYVVRERRERAAYFRALYEKFRCVHEHEGAWNDPDAPYYGGLQMDVSFQRAYGPEFYTRWGTADRWPVYAQLLAAERGWQARGWHPWPTTARACGLL